jgi:hypothetical protein
VEEHELPVKNLCFLNLLIDRFSFVSANSSMDNLLSYSIHLSFRYRYTLKNVSCRIYFIV